MYIFKRQFVSDRTIATKNIHTMLRLLRKVVPDEELLYDIRLIINELIFNGLEHGNQFDINKKITFKIKYASRMRARELIIVLTVISIMIFMSEVEDYL